MNIPPRSPSSIDTTSFPEEFQQVILEKSQNFFGRTFVFSTLCDFLHRHNRGYFTIVGTPGSGKSAILAKYAKDNTSVIYYNAQLARKNSTEIFIPFICKQIANTLPTETLQTNSLNTILQQVSNKLEPSQKLVILIDGLDAANRSGQPPGSNLFYLPRYLPEKVYFILTRRPFLKEKSGLLIEAPSLILDLDDYTEENRKDVQAYIRQNLAPNPSGLALEGAVNEVSSQDRDGERLSELIARLTDISENNFMYLSQILPVITKNYYPDIYQLLNTSHIITELPSSLKNYYQTLWQKMTSKGLSDLALDVLRVLVKSDQNHNGVSVENVAQIIYADEFDVEEVFLDWVEFLQRKEITGETCYRLFHSGFCDWLAHKIKS